MKLAGRRPSRSLPRVNYKEIESSDEEADETFNSVASNLSTPTTPLSPSHPQFLLQPSPPPINQVLTDVASKLVVVESIQAVVPNWPPLDPIVAAEEDVEEPAIMPNEVAAEVDFEDEAGEDGAKAMEYSRSIKMEYSPDKVEFWFTQIENEMYTCEIKSQWLKRCVRTCQEFTT